MFPVIPDSKNPQLPNGSPILELNTCTTEDHEIVLLDTDYLAKSLKPSEESVNLMASWFAGGKLSSRFGIQLIQ